MRCGYRQTLYLATLSPISPPSLRTASEQGQDFYIDTTVYSFFLLRARYLGVLLQSNQSCSTALGISGTVAPYQIGCFSYSHLSLSMFLFKPLTPRFRLIETGSLSHKINSSSNDFPAL